MSKARMTVTVDRELIAAGSAAVKQGVAESLSAWVNLALTERAAKDRRLRALGKAVAAYEAEFGVISDAEIEAQLRADRTAARVVRASPASSGRRGSGRRGVA